MIAFEVGPRYVGIVVQEIGVQHSKFIGSLVVKNGVDQEEEGKYELSADDSTRYRLLLARASYLAPGRPDIQLACKQFSSKL